MAPAEARGVNDLFSERLNDPWDAHPDSQNRVNIRAAVRHRPAQSLGNCLHDDAGFVVGRMNRDFTTGALAHCEVEQLDTHPCLSDIHAGDEPVVAVHS